MSDSKEPAMTVLGRIVILIALLTLAVPTATLAQGNRGGGRDRATRTETSRDRTKQTQRTTDRSRKSKTSFDRSQRKESPGKWSANDMSELKGKFAGNKEALTEQLNSLKAKFDTAEIKEKLQQTEEKLKAQLEQIQTKFTENFDGDPEEMKSAAEDLKNSMTDMMDEATRPDPAYVQAVAEDLTAVLQSGELTPQQMIELTKSVSALLTASNITMAEATAVAYDVQALLAAAGVSQADAQALVNSLMNLAQSKTQ